MTHTVLKLLAIIAAMLAIVTTPTLVEAVDCLSDKHLTGAVLS